VRVCSSSCPIDALEDLQRIIMFMREALCGGRDVPFSDTGLCGAQLIFWALEADVMEVRERIVSSK